MNYKDILKEYYDVEGDANNYDIENIRQPRLTLQHVNKMRKVRDMREIEKQQHSKLVKNMYANQSEEGGGEF